MAKRRIIIDYSGLSDTQLDQKADRVLQDMAGNTAFPTPTPPLADLQAAQDEYRSALTDAAEGGALAVEIKDQKRMVLLAVLRKLAQYVQLTTDDEAVMLSSGFDLSRVGSGGPLPKPQYVHAQARGKGKIELSLQRVPGTRTYQYEYKLVGESSWTSVLHTKSRYLLTGLESGKEYEFRVLPVGVSEVREYSDVVTSFIL